MTRTRDTVGRSMPDSSQESRPLRTTAIRRFLAAYHRFCVKARFRAPAVRYAVTAYGEPVLTKRRFRPILTARVSRFLGAVLAPRSGMTIMDSIKKLFLSLLAVCALASTAAAQDEDQLARQTQNPVSSL